MGHAKSILVFQNFPFRLSSREREAGVLKNLYSGEQLWEGAFSVTVTFSPDPCGRLAKPEK